MPETNISSPGGAALHIVVLGMPQAGKSSLLAALAQASQGQVPNAHFTELNDELVGFEADSAETILHADALVVAVDASGAANQLESDFTALNRFLHRLEQQRGRRAAVAGLPVFLVLIKCDLLANGKDSFAAWMTHIEERRRQAVERFHEFLGRPRTNGLHSFGRIDLHLAASAIKQPAWIDQPARPGEPYYVAELLREVLASARNFQRRRSQSSRRLFGTVAGSVLFTAGMLALALFLLVHRTQEDPRIRELVTKIESYRMREPMTPSNRLRGQLQLRISELTELKSDPDFGKVPRANQQYVTTRLGELQDYRLYHDQMMSLPPVSDVHGEKELTALETRLQSSSPAAEHQADWSQTEAALFRAQQLDQIKALRAAVVSELAMVRKFVERGEELWTFAQKKEGTAFSWPDWNRQLQRLLEESDAAQHRPSERVPGSEITYETVFHYDTVAVLRAEWQGLVLRLQRVSNLGAALGLGSTDTGRAPLDIPEGFTVDQAASREQRLRRAYPHFQEEFILTDLPNALVAEIRSAAVPRYGRLLKAGQEVVLRHLQEAGQGSGESFESWRRLRSWIDNPPDLQAWRGLATVLARLQWPEAEDPVTALANFLKKEQFDLALNRLVLEIPDAKNIRPSGKLVVHHGKTGVANVVEVPFELIDNGRSEPGRQSTRYAFKPAGPAALIYRPGDTLWADLPVKSGDGSDWMLTWTAGRSQVYQFERLAQPPRLHRKEQSNLEGKVERIVLQVAPDAGLPKVPDLLPVVP